MSWLCKLFGHVDHRERDDSGRYIWRCQKCGDVRIILAGQELKVRPPVNVQYGRKAVSP